MEGTVESITTQTIKVSNNTKYDEYVKVLVYKILNPGMPNQKESLVKNSNQLELTVYPKIFKLSPNETESIRIITSNKTVTNETLYRVRVIPGNSFDAGLTVKVSYGVLVRLIANKDKYAFNVNKNNNEFILSNTGNRRIHVQSECKELDKSEFRLYPNQKIPISSKCEISELSVMTESGRIINE
nr:fimbria/pilus periplasmic chaperone [Shewanella nanhaiensis]